MQPIIKNLMDQINNSKRLDMPYQIIFDYRRQGSQLISDLLKELPDCLQYGATLPFINPDRDIRKVLDTKVYYDKNN